MVGHTVPGKATEIRWSAVTAYNWNTRALGYARCHTHSPPTRARELLVWSPSFLPNMSDDEGAQRGQSG